MPSEAPILAAAPLPAVIAFLRERFAAGATEVSLRVLDPDRGRGLYAGERVRVGEQAFVHRPLRVWVDLADRLQLRLHTPQPDGEGLLRLTFQPLDEGARWEPGDDVPAHEKYGVGSGWQRISNLEDPGLVLDLGDALERVAPGPGARVLDLGCNTGELLALLPTLWPELGRTGTFVGVDHSRTAIAAARERLPAPHRFVEADLADLSRLELGLPPGERFDLVLCLNTLQSPGVDDRALLRHVVQERLSPAGGLVLGIPNCRHLDGELLHGARMKNFRQPELSLLVDGIAFYRRYLHQHRRKVYVTGKHTLLVTAVPARRAGAGGVPQE